MHRANFSCRLVISITVLLLGQSIAALSETGAAAKAFNQTLFSTADSERTLILLKPDAIQRALIGKIIERFENKGFKLVALKFVWATKELVEDHYVDHKNSYFYSGLVEWMTSSPIIAMVWESWNAVKLSRRMLGPPDSLESHPGTIRGDFSMHFGLSVIHGVHSIEAANREIPLWFRENELISWTPTNSIWTHP